MSEINLNNVGPILKADINLDNGINIVIGEQAPGKSTLAKEIYFFKKIRDFSLEFICNDFNFIGKANNRELYKDFLIYITNEYSECFGLNKNLPKDFSICFVYKEGYSVSVTLDDHNYVGFKFSANLEERLKETLTAVNKIYHQPEESNDDLFSIFIKKQRLREEVAAHFKSVLDDLFCEDGDIIYIPAGRSLLAVLSEQLDVVNVKALDLPMHDFVRKIRELKPRFNKRLEEVVSDYFKSVKGNVKKNTDIENALKIIKKILRGEYINDEDGEKLFIDGNSWIKLLFSSSGQQEVLWILNMLFVSILENKRTFFIIEEPEAHLYPLAQRYIMEFIALTSNVTKSQMFITTHSPYILTSTNLLIHSGLVENYVKDSKNSVIEKKYRLHSDTVKSYRLSLEKKSFYSIMDDYNFINTDEIDEVSDVINEDTDKLIRMEVDNGL